MYGLMNVIQNRIKNNPGLYVSEILNPDQFSSFDEYNRGEITLWELVNRAKQDPMWPATESFTLLAIETIFMTSPSEQTISVPVIVR